jgi:integrase
MFLNLLPMQNPPKKLLEQVKDQIRLKYYSYRTENFYVQWIRRYILLHNKRHPKEMGVPEIETCLSYLAVEEKVSASTQNQALSALLFLYRRVLHQDLDDDLRSVVDHRINAIRAKKSQYLTPEEVKAILTQMTFMANNKSQSDRAKAANRTLTHSD